MNFLYSRNSQKYNWLWLKVFALENSATLLVCPNARYVGKYWLLVENEHNEVLLTSYQNPRDQQKAVKKLIAEGHKPVCGKILDTNADEMFASILNSM